MLLKYNRSKAEVELKRMVHVTRLSDGEMTG